MARDLDENQSKSPEADLDQSPGQVKAIIESLLFVADGPLTVDRLKAVLGPVDTRTIRKLLAELEQEHRLRDGGFVLKEVAGGFQFRSRPKFAEWIRRLLSPGPSRLSKAALETLAVIAYNQPIIRSEIEHMRGVDCGGIIRTLLDRGLVKVLGRKEIPGRPLIYSTTPKFLEIFDLKDIKDLPSPKDIAALGRAEEENPAGGRQSHLEEFLEKPEQTGEPRRENEEEAPGETGPVTISARVLTEEEEQNGEDTQEDEDAGDAVDTQVPDALPDKPPSGQTDEDREKTGPPDPDGVE